MKISQILEGRVSGTQRQQRIPVSFEYEQEYQVGTDEWHTRMLIVKGVVEYETDMYGTGDSPSGSSFEPQVITNASTGQEMSFNDLSQGDWESIEAAAIRNAEV